MLADDLKSTLAKATQAIESVGAGYMIVGSLASSLYGTPRATMDVDLVANIESSQLDQFVKNLETQFYFDRGAMSVALRNFSSFNIIDLATAYKLDIFILGSDEYAKEAFNRRVFKPLALGEYKQFYFASLEDVILGKMRWFLLGNKANIQQATDIKAMLRIQKDRVDWAYLKYWAEKVNILTLLEDLMKP